MRVYLIPGTKLVRKREPRAKSKDPTPAFRTSIPMWRTKRTSRSIISDPSFGGPGICLGHHISTSFPSPSLSSRLVLLLHRPHGAKFLHNLLRWNHKENLCDQILPQILFPDHSHVVRIFKKIPSIFFWVQFVV
jgi:hypothetical protein